MKNDYYDRALTLADDDPDILDATHEILMKDGITESAYAEVFALMHFKGKGGDERISCSSVEKVWKKGNQTLSDVKLFTALNQTCDLIHNYVLSSWESCVLSAWASRKELVKSENAMNSLESLEHAKNIITLAAPLMPNNVREARIDWTEADQDGEGGEGEAAEP